MRRPFVYGEIAGKENFIDRDDERKKLNEEITRKTDSMKEKGYDPVFMMVSDLRMYLSDYIRHWFGNWACISDLELYSVSKDISIVVEEVVIGVYSHQGP